MNPNRTICLSLGSERERERERESDVSIRLVLWCVGVVGSVAEGGKDLVPRTR